MKLVKISAIWCMSCILMNEELKRIEKRNKVLYETIDYDFDNDKKLIKRYNIGSILPIYILFDSKSNEIGRLTGEKKKKILEEFLISGGAIK